MYDLQKIAEECIKKIKDMGLNILGEMNKGLKCDFLCQILYIMYQVVLRYLKCSERLLNYMNQIRNFFKTSVEDD